MELTRFSVGSSLSRYIRTNSQYVALGLEKCMPRRTIGWPAALLNSDLWRELEEATRHHIIDTLWVKVTLVMWITTAAMRWRWGCQAPGQA